MFACLKPIFRARLGDAEEALIDTNAVPLLAQHLRDAEADTERARLALANLCARRKAEERQMEAFDTETARREVEARAALAAGEETLAGEVAGRIVDLADRRSRAETDRDDLARRIDSLRTSLAETERRMSALAAELRAARASVVFRKSGVGIAPGATALEEAERMAGRLRSSTSRIEDELVALGDIRRDAGQDLDARLGEAGIADRSAERRRAVLDRLRPAT